MSKNGIAHTAPTNPYKGFEVKYQPNDTWVKHNVRGGKDAVDGTVIS